MSRPNLIKAVYRPLAPLACAKGEERIAIFSNVIILNCNILDIVNEETEDLFKAFLQNDKNLLSINLVPWACEPSGEGTKGSGIIGHRKPEFLALWTAHVFECFWHYSKIYRLIAIWICICTMSWRVLLLLVKNINESANFGVSTKSSSLNFPQRALFNKTVVAIVLISLRYFEYKNTHKQTLECITHLNGSKL